MQEQWADINGFEGYQISSTGKVRSKDRRVEQGVIGKKLCYFRTIKGKYLTPTANSIGYLQIRLYKNNKGVAKYIHVLVIEHFGPPRPLMYDYDVDHIDNNKLNNTITNLQWLLHKHNVKKAYALRTP
jgi:hypothetical protein